MKPLNQSKNIVQTGLLKQYVLFIADQTIQEIYSMPVRFKPITNNPKSSFNQVYKQKNKRKLLSSLNIRNKPITKREIKIWLKIFKMAFLIWLGTVIGAVIFFSIFTRA